MSSTERTLVFWVPDWPALAWLEDQETFENTSLDDIALALIAQHRVVACSAAARAEGVRTGLREREALSRCPDLIVQPHNPEIDERRFKPIAASLRELVPGIEIRRPGLCAVRSRGPARYYGSEANAATTLLTHAKELGLEKARIGIADGLFTAEQVVRAPSDTPLISSPITGINILPPGQSAAYLSPLTVATATNKALSELLVRLGIRTLGALAALPEAAVQQRFGTEGVYAHRRARAVPPRAEEEKYTILPERELSANITFESPIDNAEQLGFACAALAEQFISSLRTERLVCTALRIELTDDTGSRHEREWLHPRYFSTADTVGRIRWQASTMTSTPERSGAGIIEVRITPTHTDQVTAHEPGLWSAEPSARVHHQVSRIQSKLGHTAVGTLELKGGRLLNERQRFVPWSTQQTSSSTPRASAAGAWPGSLTAPLPTQVFPTPPSAELLDASGRPIVVDAEDLLSAIPAKLRVRQQHIDTTVINWSKPWALRERWWQNTPTRFRAQVELKNGDAWLLIFEHKQWFAEGRYA